MLIGSFVMGGVLILVGILEGVYGEPYSGELPISWIIRDKPQISRLIVALSYLAVCTYATSWGPVSWTYPSEIFPNQVRAKAVSLATACNWGWNAVLAYAVPPLFMAINWKMFILFGLFNFLALITMFLFAP